MSEAGSSLGLTLGSLELGILFSTVLYGIVLVQTFNYYNAPFTGDSVVVKCLVACVFVLEGFHTACLWTYLYSRTVTNFGRFDVLDEVHWSLSASVPISCAIVFCAESFFAYRVYMLSRNRWFPAICILGLTLRLGLGTAFAATTPGYRISVYFDDFRWLNSLALSVGAAVDIGNTVALFLILKSMSTAQPRTKRIVDKLILWTIETGLLTSICAIIEVALMQTKDNLLWAFFFFLSAKFYSNSLLASLNGRVFLQNMQQEPMTFALDPVDTGVSMGTQ
ncbi:hypothetical protein K435DRAFT_35639 [Dendrothele bispora CBS 962.96]|uniref:DUF6534 domain-containing protein n=1 Tax=Dendrothele bispora (strain CBS 962.96) TaxID=1314807 RepID=A0A4S8M7E2_DENBC|nr:hypothetical protein K435DRAFT_35639 [Dendrothele bispora CBS 962.96]